MVARIESSSALSRPNWYARLSVVVGLLALAVGPVAIVASNRTRLTLIEAVGITAASGLVALLGLAPRAARPHLQRPHAWRRAGGARLVRTGRILGVLGLCIAVAAGIALAFYAVLQVFLA